MQIVLHADKNREYEYAVDSGCSKEITIKKRTTLRVPNGSSTLVFRQAGFCKKQNIFTSGRFGNIQRTNSVGQIRLYSLEIRNMPC